MGIKLFNHAAFLEFTNVIGSNGSNSVIKRSHFGERLNSPAVAELADQKFLRRVAGIALSCSDFLACIKQFLDKQQQFALSLLSFMNFSCLHHIVKYHTHLLMHVPDRQ